MRDGDRRKIDSNLSTIRHTWTSGTAHLILFRIHGLVAQRRYLGDITENGLVRIYDNSVPFGMYFISGSSNRISRNNRIYRVIYGYRYDDYGWYAGDIIGTDTSRATQIELPSLSIRNEVGANRANFSNGEWLLIPFELPEYSEEDLTPYREEKQNSYLMTCL